VTFYGCRSRPILARRLRNVRVLYPTYRLFGLVHGIVVFAALWCLDQTRLGALIRAGVDDAEMVESSGSISASCFCHLPARFGFGRPRRIDGRAFARLSVVLMPKINPGFSALAVVITAGPAAAWSVLASAACCRSGHHSRLLIFQTFVPIS